MQRYPETDELFVIGPRPHVIVHDETHFDKELYHPNGCLKMPVLGGNSLTLLYKEN